MRQATLRTTGAIAFTFLMACSTYSQTKTLSRWPGVAPDMPRPGGDWRWTTMTIWSQLSGTKTSILSFLTADALQRGVCI
jgi:hypothetical protein